jgi:hypothetical protein
VILDNRKNIHHSTNMLNNISLYNIKNEVDDINFLNKRDVRQQQSPATGVYIRPFLFPFPSSYFPFSSIPSPTLLRLNKLKMLPRLSFGLELGEDDGVILDHTLLRRRSWIPLPVSGTSALGEKRGSEGRPVRILLDRNKGCKG